MLHLNMITLSVVIPTKDREEALLECVDSIINQFMKPVEVLIMDDGQISESVKEIMRQSLSKNGISLKYFKKETIGLADSKNLGAKESQGQIVLFLDDDVVLEQDYIENIVKVWAQRWSESNLAGVAGVIINSKRKSFGKIVFEKIFCLHRAKSWSILPWGFQTQDFDITKEEIADWIPGGMSSFRKHILDDYQFASLQPGRTALEDLEFCWRLKNDGYYFIVTPCAKLIHRESIVGRESTFLSGFKEAANRKVIFGMHAEKIPKKYCYFWFSAVGGVAATFLSGNYIKSFGMMKGYLRNEV